MSRLVADPPIPFDRAVELIRAEARALPAEEGRRHRRIIAPVSAQVPAADRVNVRQARRDPDPNHDGAFGFIDFGKRKDEGGVGQERTLENEVDRGLRLFDPQDLPAAR